MRDIRFIAAHRGGPLSKEHQRQLITWATDCAEHVLPFAGDSSTDERLLEAIKIARAWARGEVPVGAAQKASLGAHATARAAPTPAATAVARAVGQAVATAHMADHSLGCALYALKAVKAAGESTDLAYRWQLGRLPLELKDLVPSALEAPRFGKVFSIPLERSED